MFVAAPNCVETAIIFLQDDQPVENTFHYRLDTPASLADLMAMANSMDGWVQGNTGIWPTNVGVVKYYLRALDSETAPTFEMNPASITDGGKVGTALPNDVTLSITRYSGLQGRKNRGRLYHVGIVDADLSGANTINTAVASTLRDTYDLLRIAMETNAPNATEIILHRADGTHVDVIGYRYADIFLDSQRRRLPAHNVHR